MPQVIRIKRNVTSAAGPGTLDPGELGYTGLGAVQNLYVGDGTGTVQNLVNPLRQVEIAGAQTITGVKTFDAIGKINIIGGAVGAVLQSADPVTGALIFGPAVTAAQLFVGQFDGSTGIVTFTGTSGGVGPGLPAPGAGNNGWYVIANVAGATPPTGSGVPGPFEVGDWLISNGTAWTHLNFGGTAVSTASDVGVVAPLVGPTVQDELESLVLNKVDIAGDTMTGLLILSADPAVPLGAATKQYVDTKVTGPATAVVGNIATFSNANGKVIQDSLIVAASLATITYVDSENVAQDTAQAAVDAAQDLIITANAAFVAAQPAIDAAQDTAINDKVDGPAAAISTDNCVALWDGISGRLIKDSGVVLPASFGDVVGPASVAADGNIAVYNLLTGKVIKDGGTTIAALQAAANLALTNAQLLDVKIAGSTMTGALILSEHPTAVSPVLQAATKQYVDDQLAGSTVVVTGPELSGDGSAATPVTFTGITTGVPVVGDPASFTGNGLLATPLVLTLVDGGTY